MKNYDKFLEVIDSLSKYRRAELLDNDHNIIEELYVDPLENDLVFKSMLKSDTTLLIGRKGTGKSTIINRFQHEIRKSSNMLALYIDIKSIFEQAKKSLFPDNSEPKSNINNNERIHLMQFFISKVVDEIKEEVQKDIFSSRFVSIFTKKSTKKEFLNKLDDIFTKSEQSQYKCTSLSIDALKSDQEIKSSKSGNSSGLTINTTDINGHLTSDNVESNKLIKKTEQSNKLTKSYNIISIMNELKKLLSSVGIIKIFICLDDVSEIDKESIIEFSESILAPLNNLSDEYYKFKISLYPGRDFLSGIDRTKVKTFKLDYYDLYKSGNTTDDTIQAINYTQRIIEKRIQYYFGSIEIFDSFFHIDNKIGRNDYYKLLFEVSSNIPRVIGKVLYYAIQKTNGLSKKITKRILQESSEAHYVNEVEYILKNNESIEYKSYQEAFDQYHLNKLLNLIINKAKENKNRIGISNSKIFQKYTTNTAPSHYFYISSKTEDVLRTLELNFFLSKYSEQKQREGNEVSVFVLNYGLCIHNDIIFDNDVDRKYRIERVFDFDTLVLNWMNSSKRLICSNCKETYELEMKQLTDQYGCLKCRENTVKLEPILSPEEQKRLLSKTRLPKKEYEILISLYTHGKNLSATEIGADLDRAYQSINYSTNINSQINKMGFIMKSEQKNKGKVISITQKGIKFITDQQ